MVPVIVGVAPAVSGIGLVAPTYTAGLVAGDVSLLFVECESADSPLPPAGWAHVAGSPQAAAGTKLSAFWRRFQAGDVAPVVADPGNHAVAQILSFRGCIAVGDPWDVTFGGIEATVDVSLSAPGLTTTVPECLVVVACSAGTDSATPQFSAWANASLLDVLERADSFATAGLGGGFGVATGQKLAAGAVSATTATLATAASKAFLTIALKPGAAPSGLDAAIESAFTSIIRASHLDDHVTEVFLRARLKMLFPAFAWDTNPPAGMSQATLLLAVTEAVATLGG